MTNFLSRLKNNEPTKAVLNEFPDANLLSIIKLKEGDWYDKMMNIFLDYQFASQCPKDRRRQLSLKSKSCMIIVGHPYKKGLDHIIERCISEHQKQGVIQEAHEGFEGGNSVREGTVRKVLQVGLWRAQF